MFGFVPRSEVFFDLLDKLAATVSRGAAMLAEAADGGAADFAALRDRIKVVEHEGDQITHETIQQINRSFITPLDREDIHTLVCRLDDILDLVDTAIARIVMYRIDGLTDEAQAMIRNLAKATTVVAEGVQRLRRSRGYEDILTCCIEIHTCENEGDRLEHVALASLFDRHTDPITIIKWKDVYQDLEAAVDRCEDAANVLETLALKSA